ncbi:hypothetical protein CL635_01400 [bacterium]|nr:hypothetical protein [bacterium]|tara:strand:- start:1538 stop:1747 length:210 start_codon:yes stop_codon:yes gene_type:complete
MNQVLNHIDGLTGAGIEKRLEEGTKNGADQMETIAQILGGGRQGVIGLDLHTVGLLAEGEKLDRQLHNT